MLAAAMRFPCRPQGVVLDMDGLLRTSSPSTWPPRCGLADQTARMNRLLVRFLSHHQMLMEESVVWGHGLMPLRLAFYLSRECPPLDSITSVRSVVLKDSAVFVVRDVENRFHVTPGGRREAGESIEETLRRELLEETGWTITDPLLIGFIHFHHLAARPADYQYPHPDFLQVVYVSQAGNFVPEMQLLDEHQVETGFRPVAAAQALNLDASQRLFLNAALAA